MRKSRDRTERDESIDQTARRSNRWRNSRVLSVLARAVAADAKAEDGPKIAGCHIGFGDQFKVGYWTPIWVDVAGAPRVGELSIEITTNDSDGVATTVSGPVKSGVDSMPLYVKLGRIGNPIHVALVSGGQVLDHADLESSLRSDSVLKSQPATSELIVQLGAASAGLAEAFPDHDPTEGGLGRRMVHVDEVNRLPTDWFGYEGVDLLLLTTSDPAMSQKLVADERRFTAIKEWVELGGRLVISCGRNAPKLISETALLAELLPGKFAELIRLPQTRGLENFAESNAPIGKPGAQLAIAMPRLTDVRGQVEVFGRGSELPIVVRSARGLGEIMFVGLDLDQPPLSDWAGREAFWRAALRPYLSSTEGEGAPQRLSSLGYSDLSGALRQRLGREFATVTTISFSVVAGLILAYLLLLGPLDYLFVHRLVGRPLVAWISFPLLVLATCCGAAALAHRSKGTQPHVNQTELVDFDSSTGRVRGSYWSMLYSPNSDRYDLTLAARLPGGHSAETPETLLSWFGLAGSGLGGMNGGGAVLDIARTGYQLAPRLDGLAGVPILTGSTKAIAARWTASAACAMLGRTQGGRRRTGDRKVEKRIGCDA